MPTLGRNEKCHCGSGKKYKNCCMQKDLEAERNRVEQRTDEVYEEMPAPALPTWKIVVVVLAILIVISVLISFVLDMPKLGGSFLGVGVLILVFFAAFRNVPTVRSEPGDAGNIDFGNRQGVQPVKKK